MKKCSECSGDFTPSHKKQIYCSLSCSNLARNRREDERRRAAYAAKPTLCEECSAPLSFEQSRDRRTKFCSRSCAVLKNNREGATGRKGRGKITTCAACGVVKRTTDSKFCSMACSVLAAQAGVRQRIDRGEVSTRAALRKHFIQVRGHKCEECGIEDWSGQPVPLVLDHIDGDAGNNLPSNLRLLCRNCEGLTPTFSGRNKGRGRKSRGLPLS